MRVAGMGDAGQQIARGIPQHEKGSQKKQHEDDAAHQYNPQEAWPFTPVARIARYAMDKWLNHNELDVRSRNGVAWRRQRGGDLPHAVSVAWICPGS